MAIDASIYSQQRNPDFLGSIGKGMSLGQMIQEKQLRDNDIQKQKDIQEAFRSGIVQNPDGTTNFNSGATLASLANKGYGREAYEFQQQSKTNEAQQQKANMDKMRAQLDMTAQLLGGVRDQTTYDLGLQQASKFGIDVSTLPKMYNPKEIERLRAQTLSAKEQFDQIYKNKDFDLREKELQSRSLDRKEARDERRYQAGVTRDEKIQSLHTPYGLANTPDDAKKLKDAYELKKSFDSKIDQMIALREKHSGGAILNREDVESAKSLSSDLLLAYKDLAKLGVLSQSDEKILNSIIPKDPLEYNSPLAAIQGQDPTLYRMKMFKANSDKDFQTRVETRTRSGMSELKQENLKSPDQSKIKIGTVEDGFIFLGGDPANQSSWKRVR